MLNNLVSLIVPAYNAERTIGFFFESVRKQSHKNIEIIVVNDGSTDSTENIVRRFMEKNPGIKIILIKQENQGMTSSRNNGVALASGKYFWFLDSDMELIENVIESAVDFIEKENLDGLMIPERSKGSGFWARCRGFEKIINDDDLPKNAVRFMKREVIEKIGLYNTNLIAAEDYEFHDRFLEAGFRSRLLKNHYIYHYEVGSVWKMIKKAYKYGKTMPLYIKIKPKESFKQFFIVRPAYFKNWKKFVFDPISGFGLIFIKLFQYLAASLGMIMWLFKIKK